LPMEPNDSSGYSGVDAGDGALLVGASKKDILAKLDRNLASVPYIKGVNNHMGSKFTENGELMSLVLDRIQSEGLFFIDSRTSKNTTGYEIAKKLRIKTAQRDVFLDRGPKGVNYVRSQIEKLITISKERGYAVGICHPYPHTLVALSEMIPKVKDEVDIMPASLVVN
ncbi:MAG: divergent polysaccharide deacetylase family protein, partial [Thermodesulfobacteriota bacterium]